MASGVSMVCDRLRRHPIKYVAATIAITVLAMFMFTSCSFIGGPVSGQVIDAETGQPIAGAIVVARWKGSVSALVDSQSVCFHVETAVSDPEGKYHVPLWWQQPRLWLMIGSGRVVEGYRAGYEGIYPHSKQATEHPDDIYMKRFVGTDSERLQFINERIFSGMSCINASASRRNLFFLESAAIQEAKRLASSDEQQKMLEGMRRVAADDWLAGAPNYDQTFRRPLENLPQSILRSLE